jgi:soluble lytic murein transglycosylase-like protein
MKPKPTSDSPRCAPGRPEGRVRPLAVPAALRRAFRGMIRHAFRRAPGAPRAALAAAAVVLSLFGGAARADVYGYIDAQGSPHFATEKLDERYQLFLKGDEPFDSARLPEKAPATAGATAAATVKPALARYLSENANLKKYEPLLKGAAREFSVDPALLKAVMAAESGFDTMAVSPKGAIGLMQVMPATAERYGLQADRNRSVAEKLHDPKINIRLAARYLRDLGKMFPDQLHLVLASYNAGEGAVQKYRNTVPPYEETRNYVKLVTSFHKVYDPAPVPAARASAVGVATAPGAAGGGDPRRVFMTIPGRGNMLPSTVK